MKPVLKERFVSMHGRLFLLPIAIACFFASCSLGRIFSTKSLSFPIEIHIQELFIDDQIKIRINEVLIFDEKVSSGMYGFSKSIITEVPGGINKISVLMNNEIYTEKRFSPTSAKKKLYICIRAGCGIDKQSQGRDNCRTIKIKVDCTPGYA